MQNLLIPKTIMSAWNYRRYRYCRFLSSARTLSVVRRCTNPSIHFFVSTSRSVVWQAKNGIMFDCAHIQAFTSLSTKTLSSSRSVVDCALCGVVWCIVVCVCRYMLCWCWCAMCGACCVWCMARLGTRKPPVCRFKTHPCVPAKRPHFEHMRAFCPHTRKRFEPTHGDVWNLHTERREGGGGFSSLSSLLSFSLPSFSLSSFSLPSFSS